MMNIFLTWLLWICSPVINLLTAMWYVIDSSPIAFLWQSRVEFEEASTKYE